MKFEVTSGDPNPELPTFGPSMSMPTNSARPDISDPFSPTPQNPRGLNTSVSFETRKIKEAQQLNPW